MPMHDWTLVEAGIYHAFHHRWISALSDELNSGLLPSDYYALPEQVAAGLGPDVLTLQDRETPEIPSPADGSVATLSRPKTRFMVESAGEVYRRKKSSVVIRHVSGDRIVAIVEVLSPGNKASQHAFQSLVNKACEFIAGAAHLILGQEA